MSGEDLGHVGFNDRGFELLVLNFTLHLGLGMEHGQLMFLVGRLVTGFKDRPNKGRPKAQE